MFQRFSPAAQLVAHEAWRRARAQGREHVATGDLLLALVTVPDEGGESGPGSGSAGLPGDLLRAAAVDRAAVAGWLARVRPRETAAVGSDVDTPPLTAHARAACDRAYGLTVKYGHLSVEPSHLLLSLLEQPDNDAHRVLLGLGADAADLRTRTDAALTAREEALGALTLTPRCAQILVGARRAAHERGHRFVGVEHLLVAMLDDRSSVATAAIQQAGLPLDDLRAALDDIMASDGDGRASGT